MMRSGSPLAIASREEPEDPGKVPSGRSGSGSLSHHVQPLQRGQSQVSGDDVRLDEFPYLGPPNLYPAR